MRGSHAGIDFYASDFAEDERRVADRFARAGEAGVPVDERRVSHEELEDILRRGCRLIVLVDWRKLTCLECGRSGGKGPDSDGGFVGHYVLVYGLSDRGVVYANPGCDERGCVSSKQVFTAARLADGTDEDLVVIAPMPHG